MADTAAHLIDRVFPRVPVRQWVLSIPRQLRYVLARDAKLLTAALRVFVSEVFRSQRRRGGIRRARDGACGGVTGVQRFGGALNLNIHLHTLVLDGVYPARGNVGFRQIGGPSREDLGVLGPRGFAQ